MSPALLLPVLLSAAQAADTQPAPVWTLGGRCLAGVCTGEPVADPERWERVQVVPGGELLRVVQLQEPWVELGVMVDTATGRIALVAAWTQGRPACEAARDALDAMVEKKALETSVDWWTWKSGQSVRLYPPATPRRGGARVLEACELTLLDPRFDDRTRTWEEDED